jgi:hypothetical protein
MIRVSFSGLDESKKFFEQVPKRLGLALIKAMQESAILIQSLAKSKAPVFRGFLRLSIVQSLKEEGNRIVGEVGSALPYAPIVEFGKSAGWFPNLTDLKVWARRKLGNERLAFVVGRAIKKRGFRAQPYLGPALEEAQPRFQLLFAARITQAVAEMGGNV